MDDDHQPTAADLSDARASEARLTAEYGLRDPFAAAVRGTRMAMIITDPTQPDNPIIFANRAFCRLTGYAHEELIGRNCRFLQGPGSDPAAVTAMRENIARGHDVTVEILNYRKDGTPFWNALYVSPVHDEKGAVRYFFGSQIDVSEKKETERRLREANGFLTRARDFLEQEVGIRTEELTRTLTAKTALVHELDHRVKNNLQLMAALVGLEMRKGQEAGAGSGAGEQRTLGRLRERLQALGTVHRKLYNRDEIGTFDAAEFAQNLARDLIAKTGREDIALGFDVEPVIVPADKAAPIALILNELIIDALHHAFVDGHPGRLKLTMRRLNGHFIFEVEDDGFSEREREEARQSSGGAIIDLLARQLEAEVEWHPGNPGSLVRVTLPVGSSVTRP
ncbi:MAG TPA: PAS domain-containing protein [Beijerinckiaceae bacterium]